METTAVIGGLGGGGGEEGGKGIYKEGEGESGRGVEKGERKSKGGSRERTGFYPGFA